jgi:hypothetical protein
MAPAVRRVPLKFNVLGALIVKEPNTVNESLAPSLILKVPVLLNTKL